MKAEARRVAAEMNKRQRARKRILKKVKNLSTADLVHVLEARTGAHSGSASSAAKPCAPADGEPEAPPPDPEADPDAGGGLQPHEPEQ